FAAVKSPENEAPTNAALADRNEERLTLLRARIMAQVCAPASRLTTHNAICGEICRSCRCCGDSRSSIVTVEPPAQEAHARVSIDVTTNGRDRTRYYRVGQA